MSNFGDVSMKYLRLMFFSLLAVLSTASFAENGEQKKVFGDYTVFYNAFNSSELAPEVARQYSITRAGNLGVVNIAVRKKSHNDSNPVSTIITGNVLNLLSQGNPLRFKKVEESGAIYYLATFRFENQDTLTFNLSLTPEEVNKNFKFSFQNQFFIDE